MTGGRGNDRRRCDGQAFDVASVSSGRSVSFSLTHLQGLNQDQMSALQIRISEITLSGIAVARQRFAPIC